MGTPRYQRLLWKSIICSIGASINKLRSMGGHLYITINIRIPIYRRFFDQVKYTHNLKTIELVMGYTIIKTMIYHNTFSQRCWYIIKNFFSDIYIHRVFLIKIRIWKYLGISIFYLHPNECIPNITQVCIYPLHEVNVILMWCRTKARQCHKTCKNVKYPQMNISLQGTNNGFIF